TLSLQDRHHVDHVRGPRHARAGLYDVGDVRDLEAPAAGLGDRVELRVDPASRGTDPRARRQRVGDRIAGVEADQGPDGVLDVLRVPRLGDLRNARIVRWRCLLG